MNPMEVYIVGSRVLESEHIEDRIRHEVVKAVSAIQNPKLAGTYPNVQIAKAKGTSAIANLALRRINNIEVTLVDADWKDKHGQFRPQAGMERNDKVIPTVDRVLIFWDGESAGAAQALKRCQEWGIKHRVFRLDQWSLEEAGRLQDSIDTNGSVAPATTTKHVELDKPRVTNSQFKSTVPHRNQPALMSLNSPNGWIYVGQSNKFTALEAGPLSPRFPTHDIDNAVKLAQYRSWLMKQIDNRNWRVLRALHQITPTTHLYCTCNTVDDCIVSIIIRCANFMNGAASRHLRLPQAQIDAYELLDNPTKFMRDHPKTRDAQIHLFYQGHSRWYDNHLKQARKALSQPAKVLNEFKAKDKGKPYVTNDRVIFINGDMETPATIAHIEYGRNWVDDPETGIRRHEILNMELRNVQLGSVFIWSDALYEMVREENNAYGHQGPLPDHPLPIQAPYVSQRRPARELDIRKMVGSASRIKVGHVIRITDNVTKEVVDTGIVRSVDSAAWYHMSPNMPVTFDAWHITFNSLLTSTEVEWTPEHGSTVELVI